MNGRIVDSCLVLAVEADGAEITTVEGLAVGGRLTPLQQAFLDKGAVQCGFCIPGQLVAATDLLARNPHPTVAEVQEGLAGNLCRCACYVQITDAVLAAAEGRRAMSADTVGGSPARVGGVGRVTGLQQYVADIRLPDVLQAKLVTLARAPVPGSSRSTRAPPSEVPGVRLVDDRGRPAPAGPALRAAVQRPAGPRRRGDEVPRRAGGGSRGRDRRTRPRRPPASSRSSTRSCRPSSRSRPPSTRRPRSSRTRRCARTTPWPRTNVLREHRVGWGDVDAAHRRPRRRADATRSRW